MKGNLLICLVLNLLGLPFFALGHLHMSAAQLNGTGYSRDFFGYASFCGPLCVYTVMILAVTGAAASFVYFNKKEFTDTLGVLPLSHRERFWGDFFGDYIANVAPFIPCALIAAVMFAVTQNNYAIIAARSGGVPTENYVKFIVGLSLSLLFVYTFAYVISALVTSIFGRFMFAEMFSVIGSVVSTVLIVSVSNILLYEMPGVPSYGAHLLYAMPLGPLFGEISQSLSAAGAFRAIHGGDMKPYGDFIVLKPLNTIIFIAATAALTVLTYYISKSRKQERVGKIMVHGAAFRGLELFTAATAVMIAIFVRGDNKFLPGFLIGAAIGVAVTAVFEIIRRPRAKELLKTALGYAYTLIACYGICVLFRNTGAFGMRYINVDSEQVEYVAIGINGYSNGSYKLTEKSDIRKFTEKHNSILRSGSVWLIGGDDFTVEYKLTDGTTITRGYGCSYYDFDEPIRKMTDNLRSLDGYPKALCGYMNDGAKIESVTAELEGVYGSISVPTDKTAEFIETLSSEIIGNYSADGEECGSISIVRADTKNGIRSTKVSVQKNYGETVRFLRALDSGTDNGNQLALSLSRGYIYPDNDDFGLKINIYKKDMEDRLVKELLSLLKLRGETDNGGAENEASVYVESTNLVKYYVSASAEKRVTEIMLELAVKTAE